MRKAENTEPRAIDDSNPQTGNTEIAGVELTHPDRLLYPKQGITKRELAQYYTEVADWMLPHVGGRPLTLLRCPQGQEKQCFYQRNARGRVSPEIRRLAMRDGRSIKHAFVVDSLAGLIALVQMGVLEIHTWGSTAGNLKHPDRLTFDLDPAPSLPWKTVRDAAAELRDRITELGLCAFVKSTGGKGLHLVVPIAPTMDWERAKAFAKAIAQRMAADNPKLYVATMSKSKRTNKTFIDYLRNARSASAIGAYSTRARPGAPVAVPLGWEDLGSDVRDDPFTAQNLPARLRKRRKNPWDDFESARREVTTAMRRNLGVD